MISRLRRLGRLLLLGLFLAARPVAAQISLETEGGWTFTFAGNVSAFYIFEHESADGAVTTPGANVGIGRQGSSIRSGYLPAFAVFDAKRTEGSTRLGVHFGFAPQIQTTGGHDDSARVGARLDMRQVYLTVGGAWGQLLAGRELGIFGRQNMLADMSLFGVGATGGSFGNPPGATLGRSGFGYIYPGFNAQFAYSTPREQPVQLTVGIFDPSVNNGFTELLLPRLEGELSAEVRGTLLWAGGVVQSQRDTLLDRAATAWGATAGARVRLGEFTVVATGFVGEGIGTTLLFRDGRNADPAETILRHSSGYVTQITWARPDGPLTFGLSWGDSWLRARGNEAYFRTRNGSVTAGAYLKPTPSLRVVGEATLAGSNDTDPGTPRNSSFGVATGLMLFF
ncbi:MAG TPA: porin [Gemmatimonadales bacterium]|nr:porin [Gemmatimonadales bacterium]